MIALKNGARSRTDCGWNPSAAAISVIPGRDGLPRAKKLYVEHSFAEIARFLQVALYLRPCSDYVELNEGPEIWDVPAGRLARP